MKMTKKTINLLMKRYEIDAGTLDGTVENLLSVMEPYTYEVEMDCDVVFENEHQIEDCNGDYVVFVTAKKDRNKIVEIIAC